MKKTLLIGGLLALSVSNALYAQETSTDEKAGKQWLGVFGHYYRADEEKFPNIQTFEEGDGYGFEYGYRFSNDWATRLELAKIEMDQGKGLNGEIAGESIGLDLLYFIKGSETYLFSGLRFQDFEENRRLGALGVGKHWQINDKWNVITEVGGMHDFGEAHRDVIAKLGVSYVFGGNASYKVKDIDTDKDGVNDSLDRCLNTPLGTVVDSVGCAVQLDSDGDGVLDSVDNCPSTPMGVNVDVTGCEIKLDSDNDGVKDEADQCSNTPEQDKVDEVGCSIFIEEEVSKTLSITFANNSADVDDLNETNIDEFIMFLRRYPNTDALIEGHASAPGDADYNMQLSQERADAVKRVLVERFNIDGARLTTKGFGETQLVDNNNTSAAHMKNRRIVAKVSTSVRKKVTE